jgi:manganese/zinc/iron transport system ATP- binding protein
MASEDSAKDKTAVEVHDLTVSYRGSPALWGVDFVIPESTVTAIVGPNGAGKSTLLKATMGMLPLASGYVELLGAPVDRSRALIAYVPQKEEVDWDFPISVREVVVMGRAGRLPFYKRPGVHDFEAVDLALEQVGMSSFAKRQIRELSGGQQQRVFLARALAQEARIYLLDEPFAGVDVNTEAAIVELLHGLRAQGKTVVCVHHDLSTVEQYFDYAVLLNLRLIAAGKTEVVFTKENIQQAYSGRLRALDQVAEKLRQQEWVKRA